MKKINFLKAACLVMFALNITNAQELIQGGAFQASDAASWTTGVAPDGSGVGGVMFGVTTGLPAGTTSGTGVQFTLFPGLAEKQIYQRITLEAGRVYRVSGKISFTGRTANRNAQIYIIKDAEPNDGTRFTDAIVNTGERSRDKALFLEGWPYANDFTPGNTEPTPIFSYSGAYPLSTVGTGSELIAPQTTGVYIVLIKVGQWAPSGTVGVNNKIIISDLSVAVSTASSIPVTAVEIPSQVKLSAVGDVFTLVPRISPANATNKGLTWASSNTAVATVSTTGVVTAVARGNATITATAVDGQLSARSAVSVLTNTYRLVWEDNFTTNGAPDSSKWGYELGYIRNNELQYYTNSTNNVVQNAGNLELTVRRESINGYNYTSGSVITKDKHSWVYGKIEGRLKLPADRGMWSCFWTLGANYDEVFWPKCGEIDIVEHINSETFGHYTVHWQDLAGVRKSNGSRDEGTKQFDVTQWHIYSIEWTPYSIKWFVDGDKVHEVNITNAVNDTHSFHKPHYILLNQVIGGNWPGPPSATTVLPATMYCDYVKVYEYVPDAPLVVDGVYVSPATLTLPTTNTFQLKTDFFPVTVSNKAMQWQSSNTAVATVSASGVVTGVSAGRVVITGTSVSGAKTSTSEITVVDSAGLNFVMNPGFERDNAVIQRATNWGEWSPTNTTLEKAQVVATNPRTGSYHGRIEGVCNVMYFQNINSLPSGAYTLKGWFRSSGAQSYTVFSIKNHAAGSNPIERSLGTAMNAWTEVSIPVTITSGACEIGIYSADARLGQWVEFDDISLTLNPPLSNRDFSFDTISIYPNPVENNLLNISNPSADNYEIRIFNLLGKNLFIEKNISGNKTINTDFLSSGIYLVVVSNGKDNLTKKIIIP
ncbi:MAG: hypothetical protein RL528_1615 [Bacteroidota bacterium]|jgi:beta-glucanase (GH16 family)